jgi:hypothetical protein
MINSIEKRKQGRGREYVVGKRRYWNFKSRLVRKGLTEWETFGKELREGMGFAMLAPNYFLK